MNACRGGLNLLGTGYLNRPTSQRLPLRELGLAIGLRALGIIADRAKGTPEFQSRPALRRTFDLLLPYQSLSDSIIDAWLPHAQQQDEIWKAHYDINEVMLATALIAGMFLSIGGKVSKSTATINA